jgi:hypothetical protein
MLTGSNGDVARRLVLQLDAFDIDFQRVPWGEPAIRVAVDNELDAIVLVVRSEAPSLADVLDSIRSARSLSRHANVVLLVDHHAVDRYRRMIGLDVDRVASLADPEHTWRDAVLDLLDGARRFPVRAPVDVTARLDRTPVRALCRTENISASGMLLQCRPRIPVGATMEFELSVSGEPEPIRGEARVIRITDRVREGVDGIGAAFVSFLDADGSRLRSVLARRTA